MPNTYTTRELADRWKCDERTVRKMCESAQIPAFRVGNMWRVAAEAVHEYEARGTAATGSAAVEQS